jgi:hypothetical protein
VPVPPHDPAGKRAGFSILDQETGVMSKGMDQKREQKRKPAKTLDEKRAAKKAKKADKAAGRTM